MTQMLLFDSVTEIASPVVVPAVPTIVPAPAAEPMTEAPKRREEGGVTHMGDLARLVLLRYDIVQKRRQDMARRRAK